MKVYNGLDEVPFLGNAVVTMGNFDGVHLGHQHVLKSLINYSASGFETVVITFWPHPRKVLAYDSSSIRFLTSLPEKASLLQKLGLQHLIVLPFSKEFSEITAERFVKEVFVDKIGVKKVLLGYDHRFGRNREGGVEFLKNCAGVYGFDFQEIPKQEIDNVAVSSSKIRKHLEQGELNESMLLLGRNYAVTGKVVEGNKLGRTIGFPTANIVLDFEEKLIPKNGVYAVQVTVEGEKFSGMMNIGYRPTISGNKIQTLEVNILDFSKEIYGETLLIEFVKYLREEQKFPSLEELKQQLYKDKEAARAVLSHSL